MDDWNIAIMWDLNRTSRLFECHKGTTPNDLPT